MIPLCSRESVEYVDDDGTKWTFKPLTGDGEFRLFSFMRKIEDLSADEFREQVEQFSAEFISEIQVGDRRFKADDLTLSEKSAAVCQYLPTANRLSATEKKG